MDKSVLVLGCDDRSGLTVIWSLGRAGYLTDVGWPDDRRVVKSRYIRNVIQLPKPNDGTDAWLTALLSLQRKQHYDLIVPCNDLAIIPIQARKEEIEKHARVYTLEDIPLLQPLTSRRQPSWLHVAKSICRNGC